MALCILKPWYRSELTPSTYVFPGSSLTGMTQVRPLCSKWIVPPSTLGDRRILVAGRPRPALIGHLLAERDANFLEVGIDVDGPRPWARRSTQPGASRPESSRPSPASSTIFGLSGLRLGRDALKRRAQGSVAEVRLGEHPAADRSGILAAGD